MDEFQRLKEKNMTPHSSDLFANEIRTATAEEITASRRADTAIRESNRQKMKVDAHCYKANYCDEQVKIHDEKIKNTEKLTEEYEKLKALLLAKSVILKELQSTRKVKNNSKVNENIVCNKILDVNSEIKELKKSFKLTESALKDCQKAVVLRKSFLSEAKKERNKAEYHQNVANKRLELGKTRQMEADYRSQELKAWRDNNPKQALSFRALANKMKKSAVVLEKEFSGLKQEEKSRVVVENKSFLNLPRDAKKVIKESRMEQEARFVEKKYLSATGLYKSIKEIFDKNIPQDITRRGKRGEITVSDCLMSGLAIFGLKYPSLLQFDKEVRQIESQNDRTLKDNEELKLLWHNLHCLYGIDIVPCDTYMRERLDEIDPRYLRKAFTEVFSHVQRGNELEQFKFYDGHVLVSVDGTGVFSSEKIHCESCCKKEHGNGSVSYYHQILTGAIVHPDMRTVLPFCPEPIRKSDGDKKNDCERNASERFLRDLRREHPHLPMIIVEDALGSNGPHITVLNELGLRYILGVKPDGNSSLFEYVNSAEKEKANYVDEDENHICIEYVNEVPLNDNYANLKVNFLKVTVYDKNGRQSYRNTWITDFKITSENAYMLFRGGRSRWKIENETFNTLKNQDYNFEHNFGHGNKNLWVIFSILMMLAFLVDQVQQTCCGMFQKVLIKMGSKKRFWEHLRGVFRILYISSWADLWRALVYGTQGSGLRLTPDTS